jgi:hypothetical protein
LTPFYWGFIHVGQHREFTVAYASYELWVYLVSHKSGRRADRSTLSAPYGRALYGRHRDSRCDLLEHIQLNGATQIKLTSNWNRPIG